MRELFYFAVQASFKIMLRSDWHPKNGLIEFFKRQYQKSYGMTCSSCRLSLFLVLSSLKLNKDDEVLMTPITIPDMLNMINLSGAKCKFVDLHTKDHSLNIDSFKEMINAKTKVLLVTHISGVSQEMSEIRAICDTHNIALIEDVSQSHGTTGSGNRTIGEYSDFIISSLTVGKSISTFAGGIILTNHEDFFKEIKDEFSTKSLGKFIPAKIVVSRYFECVKVAFLTQTYIFSIFTFHILRLFEFLKWIDRDSIHLEIVDNKKAKTDLFLCDMPLRRSQMPVGLFCDISPWQAEFGFLMVKNHDSALQQRRENAKLFFNQLSPETIKMISLDQNRMDQHNYYHIPLYIENSTKRHAYQQRLQAYGVDTGGYSLTLCSELTEFQDSNVVLKNASRLHKNCIFIPLDETLSRSSVTKLATLFNRVTFEIT